MAPLISWYFAYFWAGIHLPSWWQESSPWTNVSYFPSFQNLKICLKDCTVVDNWCNNQHKIPDMLLDQLLTSDWVFSIYPKSSHPFSSPATVPLGHTDIFVPNLWTTLTFTMIPWKTGNGVGEDFLKPLFQNCVPSLYHVCNNLYFFLYWFFACWTVTPTCP
jgi:hypothetical protein